MGNATRGRWCFSPGLAASAVAAAALFGAAGPASAQSFTQSGANSTSPNNLLPFVGDPTSLDFGTDSVYIGNSAAGSFSAMAGAVLKAGSLSIGNGGTGDGTVTFTGAGTKVELGANLNRLEIGNWGTGTLTVSDGALLDAAVNAGACSNCWNVIGNTAGSTGTLTITGAGSEVRTLRNFAVGTTWVSSGFGTPGGTTDAKLNVLDGGTLRTEGAYVAANFGGPNANGNEKVNATVVISGNGSQWIVTPSSVGGGGNAFMGIATQASATADLTVSGGGLLRVDGRVGSTGTNDGINLGSFGVATMTVTGTGSRVETLGINPFINVGGTGGTSSSAAANATFEVLAGASVSTLYLNVGRNGGKGAMTIDGSMVTQSGVGTVNADNDGGAARAHIGRDGGTGRVTVRNGGQWIINDGAEPSLVAGPMVRIGRGANSTGTLTITGAGSRVELTSTSVSAGAASGDNLNPFFAVGFDNPSTSSGTLSINAGGKLVMNGNAVSTTTIGRATTLNIGGRSGTAATGTATVTGAGSEILMTGFDTLINVGREDGSTGTLNVTNQAQVSTISLAVGIGSTSPGSGQARGTVNIDNAAVALTGHRTDSSQVGAGTTIGRGTNGVGALNLTNGASLTITPSVLAGGMSLGGDQFLAGGTGTVNLAGGSSITFGGTVAGNRMTIGRSGNGTMTLTGASLVDVGALAETRVGADPGGFGQLTVSGGSKFRTGLFSVGGHDETLAGGTGVASFSGAGTLLEVYGTAAAAAVGFGGNGSLSLANQAMLKSTLLAVGAGATGDGSVSLNKATVNLTGEANDPNIAEAGAGIYVGGIGGSGSASIGGGTQVTITNNGSRGAHLALGGFALPGAAMGNGLLTLADASQIKLQAASGLAEVNIGHSGTGTAVLRGASRIDAGDGSVFVGRQVGSLGTLAVTEGSVIDAGYVGIGVSQAYDGTQHTGGTGVVVLNDSTINADMFEVGAAGILTGNNGVLNVSGDVVIGGLVSPGTSPGRIRINCNIVTLPGSRILLEISGSSGNYSVDELIIGNGATYDLASAQIEFSFLGSTDPNAFNASGLMNLDSFLRSATGTVESGLSTTFAPGQTWSNVVNTAAITATSASYDITTFSYSGDGGFTVVAVPVPEPASWGLMLFGLMAMGALARRRSRPSGA